MTTAAYVAIGVLAVLVIAGIAIWFALKNARAAGAAEVEARDAKAEAVVTRKAEQVAVEGVSDAKTVSNLNRGRF